MNQPSSFFLDDLSRRISHYIRPGIPKYMALRDAITNGVATGALVPGTRLPTEVQWAAELPLSLGTIQRALRMLAEDGVVVRQQGNGTFIAGRGESAMHAPMHCRFINDDGTGYLPVHPKVVARYALDTPGAWMNHLVCTKVLCIERVLAIGNEFSVFSRFYMDPDRIPAFLNLSLKQLSSENFKEIIMQETKQVMGRINQFMVRVKFEPEVCKLLGVSLKTIGQCLKIYAFVGSNSPIYYQELFIPPNDRTLHFPSNGRDQGLLEQ
ncbi:GntR family transcriptional regulator [Paralcaligenes sp. KSB-10]|uniref:GntR family transcriptional regulator n=1 Tax=Paralcaligenes sp. KSB-10 TaxID=2901142 RepID=UPI001E4D054D|nr:GntR family transcriptional regulator [Paralcaligenes sp. KSB-10]UHL64581.1 GntR family transcriptional regulator [Paralcaligenes sp. KSB-10]